MTQKEAKELTLELWQYLAEHPECKYKSSVPEEIYAKIEGLLNRCPLCEVFHLSNCENIPSCENCPLFLDRDGCGNPGSAPLRWSLSKRNDFESRKAAAERIVEIVSAWEPEEEQ
jgi:hypothetical protein